MGFEQDRKEIEKEFKERAIEHFELFEEKHDVYEIAKFIAFIIGLKREELTKELDMSIYDIRYIYSKIGIFNYKKTEPVVNRVRRLGYNSIFHYFSENYDDFDKPMEDLNTSNKRIYAYVKKCINVLRYMWYDYDKEKVQRLWKGETQNG